MKKLFLLFVMCLTAVMVSASGFDLQHRTKLYPGLRKAAMDSVSSGGTHAGNAQDTIRINVENGISVYSQLDEEGNKMYIFLAEVDSSQILITANMEELVSGVYSSLEGFYLAPGQTPVYGVSGSVDLQVGYAITTVVGTFLGSDGNVYVVSGHFPTPRMYTISVLPPSCGDYVPAIISPVITDAKLTMSYNANSGWYTASFVGIPGVEYAIVDNANEENVPIYEENGNWWPMFGPGNLFRLGDTTTLYFNWSDTTEYKWYSCLMQDPGDVDHPIEDNYIVFWNMNVSHGSQGMTLTASNELFSIQLAFRNVHELMPGFYTSQQNMFNLTNCWIQDAEIGQREKAQQIDAEIRDNNGQMMVEATIITQTGKMFQVRLLQQEIITPVDPNPGDSTEILPGDTTTQQPIDTTSQQPITPSERDYTIRLLPPSGNYQPAILFNQADNNMPTATMPMTAGNDGWYNIVLHHNVDYSYQSFRFVEHSNSANYIERNVWGEWYDMSAGIAYDDTTSVLTFDYSGENYRWHADAPVVVPDTVNLVFTNNFTTRDYGTDIAFYSSNSEYAAQFDIYMNGITAGTYSSANGDFDMSYTVVQTSSDYYTAAEAEATLSIEGDVIYLTGKIVANNGNVYLISMQKSTVSQTFVINCEDDFAYREYAEDDMVVAAATEDYYVQLNFATNNIRGGLYSNEDFLMQYTAIFTADRTPITAASSIIASVSIENGVTSINAEMRGMDDNIYQITMHGVLPNTEVVPGGNDSTEVVPGGNDSTIVVPGDNDSVPSVLPADTFRISASGHYENITNGFQLTFFSWQSAISKMYSGTFNFTGDMLGTYTSGNSSHWSRNSIKGDETTYLQWFEMSFVEIGNRQCEVTINALGEDNVYYIVTLTMPIPYPHTYEISILPPACMDLVPQPYSGSSFSSTLDPNTGAYVAQVQSNEGALLMLPGVTQDGYHTESYIEEGMGGYFNDWSMYLGTDTVLFLDLRTPVVTNWGDTTYYRWTECGDDYREDPEQPEQPGWSDERVHVEGNTIYFYNAYTTEGGSSDCYVRAHGAEGYYVQINYKTDNFVPGTYTDFYLSSYSYLGLPDGSYFDYLSNITSVITLENGVTHMTITIETSDGTIYTVHLYSDDMPGYNGGDAAECETTLWEGEEVINSNDGLYVLSEDGHELFEAGAEAGDYVRFYMQSNRSLSCWLDVFEGHWNPTYKEYYYDPLESEYIELMLTDSILDNLSRPIQYWGGSFVLLGDNLTLNRITLVKADCHANEPDPNTVVINCEADFTHDGSASDHYFYGDSEDGYHVQFNIRTNNLQPGTYTVDRFWTGQYTHVQTPDGMIVYSSDVNAVVTEIRRRTYIDLTITGTNGKTYKVSMTGCNPGNPTACKDTIEMTYEDARYIPYSSNQRFYIYCFGYEDNSHLNFEYSGDIFGEVSNYSSNNTLTYSGNQVDFTDFTTTFTHGEDHKTVAHIEGMGSDSLFYIINMIFTTPYPHEYTVTVLPPTCGDYVPTMYCRGVVEMTPTNNNGYTATFRSYEGANISFYDATTGTVSTATNVIESGKKYNYSWGSSGPSFYTHYTYLNEDTVFTIDYRYATVSESNYGIDTTFYRWTACGDNYSHEVAEPSEAGFGLLVVKEHTLDAAEAETLSPASVHLSYDHVYRTAYSAPTHGQLLVSDSVEMHMGRFVKSDAWGRRSPYSKARYGETYFDYNWDGISSAMINNGTMTADTVEQHTLFYTEIWHFMALPFDVKRSEIELEDGAYVAVRRFLPAEQAEGNYDDVWEDLAPNDTIHAGEGYIYQFYKVGHSYDASGSASGASSEEPWRYGIDMAEAHFKALHTANKQQMFAKGDQHIALKHQPADRIWNKNWNLISNPYQSFYNVYNCGGQGIITVYNNDDRTTEYGGSYEYVSLNDDYYVLQPGQAFFYQAADNEQQLTFPAAGQQMTAQPDGFEPGYAPMAPQRGNAGREIYNFYLSDEQQEDRARVVINESAQMDYELGRDALKLTPLELTNALFYAEDEQVEMAISERPLGDGVVYFSAKLPQDGTFSIRMDEKAGAKVMLLDTETGVMTDLTEGAYIFTETAGTYSRRFIISITGQETAIHNALNKQKDTAIKVLENNNVYIIRGGEKYDVLGKKY